MDVTRARKLKSDRFGNQSNLLTATFSLSSSLSETTSLTGDGATVISDRLVASFDVSLGLGV